MSTQSQKNDAAMLMTLGKTLLRGSGQVMFQESSWTGALFLAGIFWAAWEAHAPQIAWGALLGLVASTFAGWIMGVQKEDGLDGLWGFNGILVGCAFPTFLAPTAAMWAALAFCAMLTTWMRRAFNNVTAQFKINSLTFPFVFLTWVFLLSSRLFAEMPPAGLSDPALTAAISGHYDWSLEAFALYWLRGVSQVFLLDNWITGVLFLIGLGLCSIWAAIYAAASSALALAVAIAFGASPADVTAGLFGFSPVLTGIALGTTFYEVNWKSALWAAAGVVATVFIQAGMDALMLPWGLPTLTAPFCVATWLFLLPLYQLDAQATQDKSNWKSKKAAPAK